MRNGFDQPDGHTMPRSGLWLLMVEDQRFDAMLLRKQLASPAVGAGHVDHAETLAGAMESLGQCAYDAVLLDLGLSDSEGVQAVRTLRERFPDVVVVVLTGRDEEQLGIEAMASGAQDMLVKGSYDSEMLARALHYAIERQRLEGGLRQSAEEHRTLFENNPFPVWVYDSYTLRFLAVNEATVSEYGYSRDEFLKMTLLDLQPPEEAQEAHRRDRSRARRRARRRRMAASAQERHGVRRRGQRAGAGFSRPARAHRARARHHGAQARDPRARDQRGPLPQVVPAQPRADLHA